MIFVSNLTAHKTRLREPLKKLRKRGSPYRYDLNVYNGCSHKCMYCYAQKSRSRFVSGEVFQEIDVRPNIIETVERTLRSPDWQGEIINIGGVSDCYQDAEKRMRIMPDLWKLLIKHKNPIIISTKSDLILRDFEWIDRLASVAYVNVAVSFSVWQNDVSLLMEPGACSPLRRCHVLKEFGKSKAWTGFHLFPILPLLSDDRTSLQTFVNWASETRASYMMSALLYLTGSARVNYLAFIDEKYPHLSESYRILYRKGGADKDYKNRVHTLLKQLKERSGVNSNYRKFLSKRKIPRAAAH